MKNSSYNIFSELNSDAHPLNAKTTMMVNAINAALTTEGQNQLILQNMKGNESFAALKNGYRPMGVAVFNNIAYILSALFDTDGKFISAELGTFPSPNWSKLNSWMFDPNSGKVIPKYSEVEMRPVYSALKNFLPGFNLSPLTLDNDRAYRYDFNTSQFNLLADRMVEIELQPSYDDSINIIITDNYNPIRLINSRFIIKPGATTASLADRRQDKDTNTYSEERFNSTILIKSSDKILDLQFDGVIPGGQHTGGGYRFFFRYMDSDGTLTDIIEESRFVAIGYDNYGANASENTGKAVKFTLKNLDKKFSAVKVYFARGNNATSVITTVYEIVNIYDIINDTMTITIFGNEDVIDYNADKLNLSYSSINTVRTMTQYDDRLLLGNLTSTAKNYDVLKNVSQRIEIYTTPISLDIEKYDSSTHRFVGTSEKDNATNKLNYAGYANPDNIYNSLGVWAGETYEVAIVYIMKDYTLSPAIPVRGGDNYDGSFSYTTSSNNNFGEDGFIPNSSENNLGVYRTPKTRKLFNIDPSGIIKSEIFYLSLDFNYIDYGDRTYLQDNTLGYFITRRERKKDCIVQGMITNTTRIPVAQKIATTGKYFVNTPKSEWDEEKEKIHIQDLDKESGSYLPGKNYPFKIIPAPGRIIETHLDSERGYSETDISRFKSISCQGVTVPNVNSAYAAAAIDGKYPDTYWAFYAADQLTNSPVLANIFNGSQKGVFVDPNALKAYTNISIGAKQALKTASIQPYTYPGSTQPGGIWTIEPWAGAVLQISFASATADTQTFNYDQSVTAASFILGNDAGNFTGTFTINSTGVIISSTVSASGFSENSPFRCQLSGSCPYITPGANGNIGRVELNFSNNGGDIVLGDTYIIPFGPTVDDEYDKFSVRQDFIVSNVSFANSPVPQDAPQQPIKLLAIKDNYTFSPYLNLGKEASAYFKYIGYGIDAYSDNQFSALEDRNLYYVATNNASWTGDIPTTDDPNVSTQCQALFTGITQFSEYIGLKIANGNLVSDQSFFNSLQNESILVNNYSLKQFKNTAGGLAEYKKRLEDDGFNLGMIANIYDSISGPLTTANWQQKYSSSNASSTEPYFAITKRFTWDSNFLQGSTMNLLDCAGGDCYINYSFKRIMLQRGIPGIDTATDMKAYNNFNQAVGLMPKGFVMPILTENNYNASLRTEDNTQPKDIILYSQARSFYPVRSEDDLRDTTQKESANYNFGYNDNVHDKIFLALNNRAPSFNTNFSNRVMVSSPSVSGSFTNGYIDFTGLNFRDYNKQLGQIIKLITHNNEVYCIFEQGVGVIPVNQRTMMSEENGGVFIDNAQVLAPKMQILSTEYGSDQQFSIIKTDLAVYGCDLRKNKIWKVTKEEGLNIISDFAVQSIVKEFKERLIGTNLNASLNESNSALSFVKANYDRELNNVMFSYFNYDLGDKKITTNTLRNNKFDEPNQGDMADTKSIHLDSNTLGTLYWNETIQKWVSKLSWNPLWAFNIQNKLYSFNALKQSHKIWKHFSTKVPYCNFYGEQEKFIFEFVVVDKPTVQKILENLTIVSNRAFPSTIEYTLLENDFDFDGPKSKNNGYTEYLRQRHEFLITSDIKIDGDPNTQEVIVKIKKSVSQEEAERIKGGWIIANDGDYYLLSDVVQLDPNDKNSFYNKLKDKNGIMVTGILTKKFTTITFGIINQNAEYIEDHLYLEVGKGQEGSRIRDKAIKVKITYEGYDYVTIQTVLSNFVYSF